MPLYRPLDVRFWEKVDVRGEDECWNWIAGTRNGYGRINLGRGLGLDTAHRLSWTFVYGKIPDGMEVLHRCDNPSCVNPNHLFLGTQAENVKDMKQKGRESSRRGIYNGRCRLAPNQVLEIKNLYFSTKISYKKLTKLFNVSETQIGRIIRNENWKEEAYLNLITEKANVERETAG